jgi:hypothetical protein
MDKQALSRSANITVIAQVISLCLLVCITLYLCALGGWGPLFGLTVVPLAVCSALCLWATLTNRAKLLVFCSVLLILVGFGGGCISVWDDFRNGNQWLREWGWGLFLLAVTPSLSIYHSWGLLRLFVLLAIAPFIDTAILYLL